MREDPDRYDVEPTLLRPPQGGPRWPLLLLGLLVALLAAGGAYFLLRRQSRPPAEPAAVAAPDASPAPAVAPAESIALPPLDASDAFVRERLAALSQEPELAAWLGADQLVRRFLAVLATVAEGKSPRESVGFLAPAAGFRARQRDGRTWTDPAAHARYDRFAAVVAALDAQTLARLYRQLRPLLAQAHAEIAPAGEALEDSLRAALDRLLATPIPEGDVELVPDGGVYRYADPALEALAPAQKHLLRMGPENARRVQTKLREIRSALAL